MRHYGEPSPPPSATNPAQKRSDWATLSRLLPYLWQYKWRVVLAIVFMVGAKVANVVMLGAYIAASGVVAKESIIGAVAHMLGERKAHLIPMNEQAYDAGVKSIQ